MLGHLNTDIAMNAIKSYYKLIKMLSKFIIQWHSIYIISLVKLLRTKRFFSRFSLLDVPQTLEQYNFFNCKARKYGNKNEQRLSK